MRDENCDVKNARPPDTAKGHSTRLERHESVYLWEVAVFDSITRARAQTCETPAALIVPVDQTDRWLRSCIGMDLRKPARDALYSSPTLNPPEFTKAEAASLDKRVFDGPRFCGENNSHYYPHHLFVTSDGLTPGALCVIDEEQRQP